MSALEGGLRQLTLLDINEDSMTARSQKSGVPEAKTIIELFLREQGGIHARQMLANQQFPEENPTVWGSLLPMLVENLACLIWPISTNFFFLNFFSLTVSTSLCRVFTYHLLTTVKTFSANFCPQEYVALLQGWCEWNNCSRQFLRQLLPQYGEPLKAVDLFSQASEGVAHENFLRYKLLQASEDVSTESLVVQYYLKVVQLLECFGLYDCIVTIATNALTAAEKNDPNIPTLWSLIFKYQLELGRNEEAYTAMTSNPDISRRKDCLRQFLVVLCERRQLKALVEFPYIDMQEDLITILESRARASDLLSHNYYDLLYSFHIQCNNFRRGASTMYEYAYRD
ncbi:nuclear pore complex protein Nup160-like [Tachypleus tridentatus]|uniref:nuclear pore complex protein Nup160-like n=1 Tax=Tachypleus tridentatus TaxID=6853 RepID=UPI003FD43420